MQLKLGLYLRVSTEEQVQVIEGSLESQKHRLKSFVDYKNSQEKGWGKIVEWYTEEGMSAKDTRRPQFQRMMKDIRESRINVILVTDLSRLSRNVLDFCLLLEELKKYNAKFLSVKEQFDTSTPAGEMMILNLINLAQFERKQTSERVAMNFHSRAVRGFHNGGAILLGYAKEVNNPSTLFANEPEAKNVREIFRIFLEEGSIGKTIQRLDKLGIKPKVRENKRYRVSDKGIWSRQTLLSLIKNPTYAGLREINRENKNREPSDLKPWQQYQIVKAAWEPIVSVEIFEQAQAMVEMAYLAQTQRRAKSETRVFLVSGKLFCGECGGHFIGGASHGKVQVHRYYTHRKLVGEQITCKVKRIRADDLEEDLIKHLESHLKKEGYFDGLEANIARGTKAILGDYLGEKETLLKRMEELDKDTDLVFALLKTVGPGAGSDLVKEKLAKISNEKSVLNLRAQEIENYIGRTPSAREARNLVSENLLEFKALWKKSTSTQKKHLVHKVFEALYITPQGIGIDFKKSRSSETNLISLANNKRLKVQANRLAQGAQSTDRAPKKSYIKLKNLPGMYKVSGASADKNGGPNQSRTGDLSMPWTYDPNFTMGPKIYRNSVTAIP